MRPWVWLGPLVALNACAASGKLVVHRAGSPPVAPAIAPAAAPAAPIKLSVAKGDSLWRLARRQLGLGSRYLELAQANGLHEPYILQPGQVLLLPAGASAPDAATKPRPKPNARQLREAARYQWKPLSNTAFTTGESLLFAVQYGGITAGYATLKIPETVQKEGRPAFHIVAEARTHPFFETFFKVQDRIDSYIDTDYGFSWGYEKHIREGKFSADAAYVYDQRKRRILEPGKALNAPMPLAAQDVLSCFYYYRNLPMELGSSQLIPVTADDGKSYELKVDALRKERVSTLAGSFDCVVVQPHLTFNGVFQQKGEVLMWISDDARRIPVLIRSKIVIGKININLKDADWVEPAN